MELTQDELAVLSRCKIEEKMVFLPEQLSRNTYLRINKVLESIEGKWNRKLKCHIFPEDPESYISNVIDTGRITDYKKEFQAFFTPEHVVDIMTDMAEIESNDVILEPHVGKGNIIKGIQKVITKKNLKNISIYFNDINEKFYSFVSENFQDSPECKVQRLLREPTDFLNITPIKLNINKIIGNPPFTKQQDIKHVKHMYDVLDHNGLLVSVMGTSWKWREDNLSTNFREFININIRNGDCSVVDLAPGEFKESGTNIPTCIVKLKKVCF